MAVAVAAVVLPVAPAGPATARLGQATPTAPGASPVTSGPRTTRSPTTTTGPAPSTAPRSTTPASTSTTLAPPEPDPALTRALDSVMAISPPASCLAVALRGTPIYQHRADQAVTPASTEKLITAAAALDLLGADHRFTTTVLARAPQAGTVVGDLTLVGGGDPVLTTSVFRDRRHLGPDRTITLLDDLAAKVAASGVEHVTGRVVGDESRYDGLRVVPSWPERYVDQEQAGPLSALDVDDGYSLTVEGDRVTRHRDDQPAVTAAQLFADLLRLRGITIGGPPAAGTAPAGTPTLAEVRSPPLSAIVRDMLLHSVNQTAELLTKELGRERGSGGTTAAGVAVITAWKASHGVAPAASTTVDGSGLDPANRVTCDQMVHLLDTTGGRSGALAASLPVAAASGTLLGRFRGSAAAGRLRAKTGSLNSVTALDGFVDLPDGGSLTFAYVANGAPVTAQVRSAQDLLGTILATYHVPCAANAVHDVVAPLDPSLATLVALAGTTGAAAALPGTLLALRSAQSHFRALSSRCLALDPAAHVALVGWGG